MTIEGEALMLGQKHEVACQSGGGYSLGTGEIVLGFNDFGNNQPDNPNGGLVQVSGRFPNDSESQFLVKRPIGRDSSVGIQIVLDGEEVPVIDIQLNHKS